MIRTGQPIGYSWTHKSTFQETKKYWDIRFEDCTPPEADVLVPTSDDECALSERVKKRPRLEKLARDFLDGKVLEIHSARPDPAAFKAISARNAGERGRSVPLSGGDVNSKLDGEPSWENVDDDWEVLRKANASRKRPKKQARKAPLLSRQQYGGTNVTVEIEAASSKCSPQLNKASRRSCIAQLLPGPSEETLRQAAELRSRRYLRNVSEQPEIRDSVKVLSIAPEDGSVEEANPFQTSAKPKTAASQPTPWLSRAASPDTFVVNFEDGGVQHKPVCWNVDTPSRRSRRTASSSRKARQECLLDTALHETSGVRRNASSPLANIVFEESTLMDYSQSMEQCSLHDNGHAGPTGAESGVANAGVSADESYHTALVDSVLSPEDVFIGVTRQSQDDDSQVRLLKRQGIRAAPRRYWAPTNKTSVDNGLIETQTAEAETVETPSIALDLKAVLLESAAKAYTTQTGKRTNSGGDTGPYVARRSSHGNAALTESQDAVDEDLPVDQQRRMGAFRVQLDTAAETNEKGTPFVFRKRGKAPKGVVDIPSVPAVTKFRKTPRRVTFPSSEWGAPVPAPLTAPRTEPVTAVPPVLDMSFGHDSSFPLRLTMALVDEHLNKALPVERRSVGRSSSVKKALRRELRSSGAEITRMDGEPASSQVEPDAAVQKPPSPEKSRAGNDGHAELSNKRLSALSQWAGTQVLLQKAQRELFTSPEKALPFDHEESTEKNCDEVANTDTARNATLTGPSREPLKQLSQEPLPSTQACMDAWSPWSTVKKPVNSKRGLNQPPRRAAERSRHNDIVDSDKHAVVRSDPPGGQDVAGMRRSSLRFSMSTTDDSILSMPSPVPQARKSAMRRSNSKRSSLAAAVDILPLDDSGPSFSSTNASTGVAVTLPSFQAAQLLRDDSNPDRTLTELAHDLLSTNDISGIMSWTR